MKKLFAILLAVVMCFGACALAEEENKWVDYQPVIFSLMYESTAEVVESDPARVVSMATAVMDYALAEPTPYLIGGGDTYYLMGDGNITLFCCPIMENDDGILSCVILYDFADKVYSVRPTDLPVADLAEALSETTGVPFPMTNTRVADAAELLMDMILGSGEGESNE